MSKTEILGCFIITFFIPAVILLTLILNDMYKTGFSAYSRKLPMPPEHLRPKKRGFPFYDHPIPPPLKPCSHGFEITEVMNLKIDPCCVKCGKKLSELKMLLN